MPNCFQLTRKGDKEPMALTKIDEMICEHLGESVDERLFAHYWYDVIGFKLALGQSLDQIVNECDEGTVMHKIACFLRENFTSNAWAESSSFRQSGR